MPLEVLETTDPMTQMIQFHPSAVYEMLIGLQALVKPGGRQAEWRDTARTALPRDFWEELDAVYAPFWHGAMFLELAVDYPDHDDVPGFVDYVRAMNPVDFMWYMVGRILPPEQIAATGLTLDALETAIYATPYETTCRMCREVPLDRILADVTAFQHRLADLWQRFWDDFFVDEIPALVPHWSQAIDEKTALLDRLGGQALVEYVVGKSELPPPLPPDQPITEIVLIPLYRIPSPIYMFYGYGNVTILFDSERTEARRTELERSKTESLAILKALGDNSRLEILRLVAHYEGEMHGKKIAAKLDLSASAVSRHLNQLRDAGLIAEESQDNRTITYRLQRDVITSLPERLMDYLHH